MCLSMPGMLKKYTEQPNMEPYKQCVKTTRKTAQVVDLQQSFRFVETFTKRGPRYTWNNPTPLQHLNRYHTLLRQPGNLKRAGTLPRSG
jgi:hypothetical protein